MVDITRMDIKTHSGFTLIELLVAMAVASVLLGVGIPSFSGAVRNSQVREDTSTFTQALYLARSEAVKSNFEVTVCPRQDPKSKLCGAATTDWKNGLLVFIDAQYSAAEAAASIDPADEIIYIHSAQSSKNLITAFGSIDGSAATASLRTYIRYSNDGTADWANGSFLLCNDEDISLSRVINVAPTGDVRPGRSSGSEYPRDVFNREACK